MFRTRRTCMELSAVNNPTPSFETEVVVRFSFFVAYNISELACLGDICDANSNDITRFGHLKQWLPCYLLEQTIWSKYNTFSTQNSTRIKSSCWKTKLSSGMASQCTSQIHSASGAWRIGFRWSWISCIVPS